MNFLKKLPGVLFLLMSLFFINQDPVYTCALFNTNASHKIPKEIKIVSVEFGSMNVPLEGPFCIASGTVTTADVAIVRIRLSDGTEGYGEIAPLTPVTGETREQSLATARKLAERLIGRSISDKYKLLDQLTKDSRGEPAARCGLETALFDAQARSQNIPLQELFGTTKHLTLQTDITIPIETLNRSLELARHWHNLGFKVFKMKVGLDVKQDIKRVLAIANAYPDVKFVLDANGGYTPNQAITFITYLESSIRTRIIAFEQPVQGNDIEGMALVSKATLVAIAADESVKTLADAQTIIKRRAADIINLKIMKSGIWETIQIINTVRTSESVIELMIGGMVETRLAMAASLAIALAYDIKILDLDTPILMKDDPWLGGYHYRGQDMILSAEPGLGIRPKDGVLNFE